MGITGLSLAKLAIFLLVVLLVFGTKRLRRLGLELGKAVKSFRKAVDEKETTHKLENKQ